MANKESRNQVLSSVLTQVSLLDQPLDDYYHRILLSDYIIDIILQFNGFLFSSLIYSVLSKACKKKYVKLYKLSEEEGGKVTESTGMLYCDIMDACRYQCVINGSITISDGARQFLDKYNTSFQLAQAGFTTDLIKVKGAVFTYWSGFFSTPTKGCLNYIREVAKNNPDIQTEWEHAIERDVKYWLDSKVYGDFYVLLERRDGTTMTDKKTKKVYLVVGMAQSVGELFPSNTLCWSTAPPQDMYFHGSLIGLLVNTTLVSFDGKTTYDGCVIGKSDPEPTNVKRLLKLYITAVERGEIISSLSPVISKVVIVPKALKASLSESTSRILAELAKTPSEINMTVNMQDPKEKSKLKTEGMEKDSYFVFRRHGYSEKTSPSHLLTVVTSTQGPLVVMVPTESITPSCEEYTNTLSTGVKNYRTHKKPLLTLVDATEQVEHLSEVLVDAGVLVEWYPPPSAGDYTTLYRIYTYSLV